ncbi:hypothetical protein [Burkholderia cenocepacia]|uniref:hypothetical protein n=1 Tax=Burkholderia cenocepacia TaxID=95486 RepID=UPI0038478F68
MIFDDFDSWDGLSGLGAFATIFGWGAVAYAAYAFGFQSGVGAAKPCTGPSPTCIVQEKQGWFGIGYHVVQPLQAKQPNGSAPEKKQERRAE